MTAVQPPTYYFSGINFNSAYYTTTSSGSGLTQAQANALYLQKTTPDIATALETFTSGIATNSLNTTSASSALTIGNSTNTGTITIATINTGNTNASPAISIGADAGSKTIKINNNTNSVHCSGLDLAGSGLNNITNTTGNVDIANLQTSGVLTIGNQASRSGAIYIGNGATSTAPVYICGGSNTCTVNGTLTTPTIDSIGATSTLTIAPTNATTINIGTAASNFYLKPTYTWFGTSGAGAFLDSYLVGPLTLGALNASSITLGKNSVPTTIAGALTSTLSVNTPSVDSTGILSLGANNSTTAITIGRGSTQVVTINGSVSIANALKTPSIDPAFSGGNFNIGTITPSTINLGTASATAINIGATGVTTTINGALSTTGLSTDTGGIKTDSIQALTNTDPVSLYTTDISTISIGGGTSATTVNGTLTSTGQLTASTGLKTGAGYGIAYGTIPVGTASTTTFLNQQNLSATSATNQNFTATNIGDTLVVSLPSNSASLANGSETTLVTITIVNTGVYSMSWFANYANIGTTSRVSRILTYLRTGNGSSPGTAGGYCIPYQAQYANAVGLFYGATGTGVNFPNTATYGANGATTAFINGSASGQAGGGIVQFQVLPTYGVTPADLVLMGGLLNNGIIITRIA